MSWQLESKEKCQSDKMKSVHVSYLPSFEKCFCSNGGLVKVWDRRLWVTIHYTGYTGLLFEHVLGKSMTRGIADTVLCSE